MLIIYHSHLALLISIYFKKIVSNKDIEGSYVILENIRMTMQSRLKIATTMGYGPRYLHSTGQLHKGGPNTGIFLLLTTDTADDLNIPGKPYTFGVFRQAQARGDLEALSKHGRRVMRIHLLGNHGRALLQFKEAMDTALAGATV